MSEMETRMGRTAEGNRNLAIEMAPSPSAPCGRDHLHVPQYHNNQIQNPTESRGTQQDYYLSFIKLELSIVRITMQEKITK